MRVGYEHPTPASTFELCGEVVVRPCRADDLPALEWFGEFTEHRNIIEGTFERHLRGESVMLVADFNGFPIAQTWVDLPESSSDPAYAWAVRVFHVFQGMGIGSKVMEAAEEFAFLHGAKEVEIEVDQDNLRAFRFYDHLGYRVVGTDVGEFSYTTPDGHLIRIPKNNWRMRKELENESARSSVDLR